MSGRAPLDGKKFGNELIAFFVLTMLGSQSVYSGERTGHKNATFCFQELFYQGGNSLGQNSRMGSFGGCVE